ncbi:hypothetical protein M8312_03695 [Sphingomonas sp. KRR8]|nr:hypothetical protein [Sphingomonas sp. KRR8]URD61625.1 hypothetical protein M8312_03695 [Sphingomonas sp. KRR8]
MNIGEISIGGDEGGQGAASFRQGRSELLGTAKTLLKHGQGDSIRYKGA